MRAGPSFQMVPILTVGLRGDSQVTRMLQMMFVVAVVLLSTAAPAMAQEGLEAAVTSQRPLISFSGAFGAALTIIGAAYGIGKIGASAVESMARQPEVAGDIRGALLLAAALIEGATFFALIVCIIGG